jgi:hypothetical protein
MENVCKQCLKQLLRSSNRYCSNSCQLEYQYKNYIDRWKRGNVSGARGISTRNISGYLRRYLTIKYSEKCSQCEWNIKHPVTQRVPLEIDHIDGNSENNSEENLRLLCPNCHALTLNFKNLNLGQGRVWRKQKYIKTIN